MIQALAWQIIGAQEGAFRGTKTLLFYRLQVEEANETSLEDLEASHSNGEEDLKPTVHGRVMAREEKRQPIIAGYDHGAHTHGGYNFGMDSRMNPFKGGADSMTWVAQETIELLQDTLLFSKLQVEEANETSLEDLEASKSNREEELNHTASGRVMGREEERQPTANGRFTLHRR
ncbi:hypothetical protein M9H77_36118 [Catharanthus roseus]|uniref:Uncharacterized protein n=1 Tax=Catharanthus roseus TaxID=4058 RepID=A0ACB9ZRQ5_CATRO|nr:hypothetical protein M9H77_36118 [Catharanthus roseus]